MPAPSIEDHSLFDDYTGVVYETSEGDRIAQALGKGKAVILRNHGLLTVGGSVDEAAWWFITMERSCHVQLLAEAAGKPIPISHRERPGRAQPDSRRHQRLVPISADVEHDQPRGAGPVRVGARRRNSAKGNLDENEGYDVPRHGFHLWPWRGNRTALYK